MKIIQLIKLLEKYDPNQEIGSIYHNSWGSFFHRDLTIDEIVIDSNDELDNLKNKEPLYPLTRVLEIS